MCFLLALCHLIERRLKLEVVTKKFLHQQAKMPGSFQRHAAHGSYFWWCRYPNFSGCHLFSGSFTKITSRISVLVTLILSFCFYCTFNSVNWPYHKYINQLNFNHAFVQNLALPVFEVFFLILLTAGRSFNQTCMIFFLFLRETRTA